MEPRFFRSAGEWRAWLEANHDTAADIWVGFHKRHTARPSLTWPESVDEALCFGWIDGIRKRIDDDRYMIRFTPRRPGSMWSAVNVRRVGELRALGRVHEAGLRAFAARDPAKSGYSVAQRKNIRLPPALARAFKANSAAWRFFSAQPPSYRRNAIFYVISAKKDDTRLRRLATLIADSAAGRRLGPLTPSPTARNGSPRRGPAPARRGRRR